MSINTTLLLPVVMIFFKRTVDVVNEVRMEICEIAKETAHHRVARVACIDNKCLIGEEPAYKLQEDANRVTAYLIYQSFPF